MKLGNMATVTIYLYSKLELRGVGSLKLWRQMSMISAIEKIKAEEGLMETGDGVRGLERDLRDAGI